MRKCDITKIVDSVTENIAYEKTNWELLQLGTAANVIRDIELQTDRKHRCALIFGDTLYDCPDGKETDLCGKAFYHNLACSLRHKRNLQRTHLLRSFDHNDHKMCLRYLSENWQNRFQMSKAA